MLSTLLRIAAQLALVWPMAIYFPFAAIMLLGLLLQLADPAMHSLKAIGPALGAVGIVGLFASILLPLKFLRRPWPRAVTTILLVAGIAASFVSFFHDDGSGAVATSAGLWQIYLLGGPVVVAGWNLWRMYAPAADAATQDTDG